MDMIRMGILALPLAFAPGCTSGQNQAHRAPQQTVFDPLVQQERRASAVQQTVDEYARGQRRAIDEAEGGDASR